jgi:hypothetical protein
LRLTYLNETREVQGLPLRSLLSLLSQKTWQGDKQIETPDTIEVTNKDAITPDSQYNSLMQVLRRLGGNRNKIVRVLMLLTRKMMVGDSSYDLLVRAMSTANYGNRLYEPRMRLWTGQVKF